MIDVDELSAMFRSEARDRLNELTSALRNQQNDRLGNHAFDEACRAAHNLKGAALTVGANPVAGLCRMLELELHAQSESNQPTTAEQIATWLYVVSEMQGIIDDPNLIHIQLVGFSDSSSAPEAESNQDHVSPGDVTKAAAAPESADELATQLVQVARIQQRLTERVRTIQTHVERCEYTKDPASRVDPVIIELRSDLAGLQAELQELQLITSKFAPEPK